MTCSSCGCDLAAGAQFCVRCGVQQAGAYASPTPQAQGWEHVAQGAPGASYSAQPFAYGPAQGGGYAYPSRVLEQQVRVGQNVQALGIAWCVFGVYRLFAVAFALHAARVFGWMGHSHGLWPAIGFSSVFFSGLSVLAGLGLLSHKPWARKLALVLGVLSLVKFPIGTALGVYTLWVLGSRAARQEWQRLQMASSCT